MERWIVYAFISMAFAGFTPVIAKLIGAGLIVAGLLVMSRG